MAAKPVDLARARVAAHALKRIETAALAMELADATDKGLETLTWENFGDDEKYHSVRRALLVLLADGALVMREPSEGPKMEDKT